MRFGKCLLASLLFALVLTYSFSWIDIVGNGWLTGNWIVDVGRSFPYWAGIVLPYWLGNILIMTLAGAILIYVVLLALERMEQRNSQ